MNCKVSGFSLIEMAIVLIIIGLVGGVALPGLKIMIDRQKASTTAEHQEKILYALASYALKNGCLPNAANEEELSGEENRKDDLCRGILPYATLGLPESFAKDGYHHWFTYVVEKEYTKVSSENLQNKNTTQQQSFCRLVNKPFVSSDVQSGNARQIPLKISINNAHLPIPIAVAVISHGPEGRGAPNSATQVQGEDEVKDTTKSSNNISLVDRPISKDSQNPFSHKVAWVTAQNLMGVYGQAPCPSEQPTNADKGITSGGQASQSATSNAEAEHLEDDVVFEQDGFESLNLKDKRDRLLPEGVQRDKSTVGKEEY